MANTTSVGNYPVAWVTTWNFLVR